MAIPFLKTIADAFAGRYSDLSRHLFIFPNRRAGTFFLRHLSTGSGEKPLLLPRVTTMADFVEEISGRVVADRIELLFILYESYVSILRESGVRSVPEFDSFRRWGETALSDFNEVDMQDADADSLFKNVKDIKEISSNFLTEDQLKVMEEFFGQAYDPEAAATEFWKNFNDGDDSTLRARFRLLWQVLAPLYRRFNSRLEEKGLITTGGAYRKAADTLEENGAGALDAGRVVMVGFNALTATERRIFDALASIEATDDDGRDFPDDDYASFFWDATGPVITDRGSAAGRYVLAGMKRWPAPEWATPYVSASATSGLPPKMKVISVPSNSFQTKVISEILEEMGSTLPQSDFRDAKVAVVLPDEGLLMPMLYSLPEAMEEVNLTMGYPLRLTATYTFVSLLRRLQSTRRKSRSGIGYYYKDLDLVLSHPYSQLLFGEKVSAAKEWIKKYHKSIVDINELGMTSGKFPEFLQALPPDAGAREAALWLDRILKNVGDALSGNMLQIVKDSVDHANINVHRLALSRLLDVTEDYGIKMNWRTFLSLTDRLLASETVNFEGQPLRGLQVMGILETRALDFERIIIPSLNERILPARRRTRTFISDSLRKAYGLPPVNYSESLFAYYFYRMISRAKEVVMLYDGRSSEGARSGDVSRYVLQLSHLYARDTLKMESRSFVMSKSDLNPAVIEKTPRIIEMLDVFRDPGPEGRNLSATALTRYTECQLRFYFEHVLQIRTDETSSEYIDAITQGNVVHEVMQAIYLPEDQQHRYLSPPRVIDEELIKSRIENTGLIDTLIKRSINKCHFRLSDDKLDTPLEGSAKYVAGALRTQILGILDFDLAQAPFLLYGVEIEGNVSLAMKEGRNVNMRFAIDRLDSNRQNVGADGNQLLRIVDYKTGSIHAEAESMETVFKGEYSGRNILQLWLYANLFDALPDKTVHKDVRQNLRLFGKDVKLPNNPIRLELYEVSGIAKKNHVLPKIGKQIQKDHSTLNEEFLERLEQLLEELFDPSKPFRPAEDSTSCNGCPFKTICL